MIRRTWKKGIGALLAVCLLFGAAGYAEANEMHGEVRNVELTEEQKEALADLHKDIIEKKKVLIDKYVEYGMIPEDKQEKIKAHLDDRYNRLLENNFQPLRVRKHG
ncbi:Protein of unknown function [Alteribacillus persepolensis]|uniref:DUF2680 domain-containing protein n=1 Tax=Alteribacillus persepolensis TaxID=568899 RepID=A0A1G8ETP2_9BACI|nr:YckD family protein [Alteribacillus persepolensis]SDH73197.1 Protein of unknown function [Alteribacillus persepolensis]